MTMWWLFSFFEVFLIITFKGIHFSKSDELKSFSDILGFPMDKYEEKIFEICPFTNFCTRPAEANYTYYVDVMGPCCPQCSCSPNCFVRQDCCIDALLSTETYNFDIAEHLSCKLIDINNNYFAGLEYKLVATCPNQKGEKISCEKTIDEITRPEDIVLVSSRDGLVIFWNEDCARCHGVTDIIRWKFSIRNCIEDLFTMGLTDKAVFSYAIKNCIIFSLPPDDLDVNELKCSSRRYHKFDQCEDQDDAELVQLCDNQLVPPFDQTQTFGNSRRSKNVFCYMCNVPRNHTFKEECFRVNEYFTPLSYILELDLKTLEDTDNLNDVNDPFPGETIPSINCNENEIGDPFFGICRQFKCPYPDIAKGNTCKKPPVLPIKPTLSLSFTIHIEQAVKVVNSSKRDTKFKLSIEDFTELSNLTHCKYIVFKHTYYISKSNQVLDYITVNVDFERTNTCGVNVLQNIFSTESFSRGDKKSFHVFNSKVDNYTIVANIPVSQEDFPNHWLVPEIWLYDIESHVSDIRNQFREDIADFYFVPTEGVPCPYIYLNDADYVTLLSRIQLQDENRRDEERELRTPKKFIDGFITREYHTYGQSKSLYFACIETYLSLTVKSSITTKDSYHVKGILTLALSITSIICIMICFVIYSKSANTRSLPSKVFRIALCNLLIAQGVFQFGVERTTLPFSICAFIGMSAHFLWLSAVFSLNAFCVLVAVKIHAVNDEIEASKFGIVTTSFFVYGLPALFIGGNVLFSKIVNNTFGYGLQLCYIDEAIMRLLLFALPIFCTVIVNCIVYLYIIYTIKVTTKLSGRKSKDIKYATLYVRLLLLTGIAWIFGLLNEYFPSDVLDYCFIILIGGQGLFLFLAFNIGRIWSKIRQIIVELTG